jgi:ribosomal protein S18 acetylase RimI-like enzyme
MTARTTRHASTERAFEVSETRDKERLRELLASDPVGAAYLLGDLAEPFFSQCRWLVAAHRGRLEGAVLVYTGLSVPAVLSFGAPDAVEAALAYFARELPEMCYAKFPLEHAETFPKFFQLEYMERLWVMGLATGELQRPAQLREAAQLSKTTPIEPIISLYKDYPGNYFEPSQLESGLYFGAYLEGQLVAIAGTHVLAPAEHVAVLGNIVTSTAARQHGHATACTTRLIEALAAKGCSTVALQVAADNAAAIACYRNLGFRFHEMVWQTRATRLG